MVFGGGIAPACHRSRNASNEAEVLATGDFDRQLIYSALRWHTVERRAQRGDQQKLRSSHA